MFLQLKDIGVLNTLIYMIQHNKIGFANDVILFYKHLAIDVSSLIEGGVDHEYISILNIAHHIINLYTSFEGYSNYNIFNKEFIDLCQEFIENATDKQIELLTRNSKIFLYMLIELKKDEKRKLILSGLNNSDITFLFNNCSNIDKIENTTIFKKLSNISFYVNKYDHEANGAKFIYPENIDITQTAGQMPKVEYNGVVALGNNFGTKKNIKQYYNMMSNLNIATHNATLDDKEFTNIFVVIQHFITDYKGKINLAETAINQNYTPKLLYINDEYCNETNQMYLIDMINKKKSITNFKVLYNNI